jgi:cyanophycinase
VRGHILLEGGAEFGGGMAEPDLRALDLAGGFDAQVSIIPTAAAPDKNHERAGRNGVSWFNHLGGRSVKLIPLIDQASGNQPFIAESLENSHLIYVLGGFPGYLMQTLAGSISWQAILRAYDAGAVIGGSSAGAMVLCQHYYDPQTQSLVDGLNLVPRACVIPHHDSLGESWATQLMTSLPDSVII